MNLHKEIDLFNQAINLTSEYYKISSSIVEKDYYVTLFLCELVKKVPGLIFKGGTSLSKCFKIIDRFSEDIDITLDEKQSTQSQKKNLKYIIQEISNNLGLITTNFDETRSRRDYNCYKIDYLSKYSALGVNPQLLVETVFMISSFPTEKKFASSIIYDYLKEVGNNEAIEKYSLAPFEIRVQTLERTFVDKVFALCDYMMSGKIDKHSRHIYDLYKLYDRVTIDDRIKLLVKEVRSERKENERCFSAKDGVSIPDMLKRIIKEKTYKKDYHNITEKLLYRIVKYDDAIKVLDKIIDSKIFE